MKFFLPLALCLLLFACQTTPPASDYIVSSDIDRFWQAYDQVIQSQDTTEQLQILNEQFFEPGTPGLKGIMAARNYTPQEYLEAINNYPRFWTSVRKNTLKAKELGAELDEGVKKLKAIYPDLKPAKIYLTIGALRTNGTVMDSMLLIGCELAMGDWTVITDELPDHLGHLPSFFANNPIENVVPLNLHEYIHTQQNAIGGYDLLSQSVFEGIAEYIPVIALGKPSTTEAIAYGQANAERVRARFQEELFVNWIYHWIWNSVDNEFGVRDLGYYVGYAMAEKYYEAAEDKAQAVKDLIELDFQSREAVEAFVDQSGYFDQPLSEIREAYEANRPRVTGFTGLEEGSQSVDPNLKQFTVHFSEPLDTRFRSTDFGEMGADHFPKIETIEFSEDGQSATYTIALQADTPYQMKIDLGYRNERAVSLVPYVLEFKTR